MCTLLPASLDAESEAARNAVNEWIRGQTDEGRALADVDIELHDHERNDRLASEYDSGDGAHPNTEGMRMIARAIQLALQR
jgi:lysophospholipase L1-like esterase